MPETLVAALDDLVALYDGVRGDPGFWAEYEALLAEFVGRPSPLTEAPRLGAAEPGRVGHAQDLVDRLFAEDAEDGHDARGLRNLERRLGGHTPRTTSKNDAQVVRPRGHGHRRVLGTRQAADLGTHGPAVIDHDG